MNNTTFYEKLKTLIGKKVGYVWDVEGDIRDCFVKNLVDECLGAYAVDIRCTKVNYAPQDYVIRYKDWGVCTVKIRKLKGDSHYSWFSGSHTDYTYKDFEVNEFDFVKKIKEIDEMITLNNARKDKELSEGIELFKRIMAMYPNEDYYAISRRIDYLCRHSYTIEKALKSEKEGN